MTDKEESVDLKSILEDIQKRLATLETKNANDKEVTEQQEGKNDDIREQTTNNTDSVSDFGKLNQALQVEGDVGQTNHQHEQYNEQQQDILTDLEIQKEYQCIRDSVSRVHLDPCLRLCEGPCPVGNQNKVERANYFSLTKSSRYVETALKLIKLCYKDIDEKGAVGTQLIDQVATVLKANIDHNQKEYQAVLVASQFDQDTAKVFRTLQKNSACFTPDGVSQLKVAAELAAIKGQNNSAQNRGGHSQRPHFYGNYRGHRSRGRGFGNSYHRQRQFGNGRPDVFHDLSGNGYPPYNPNEGTD